MTEIFLCLFLDLQQIIATLPPVQLDAMILKSPDNIVNLHSFPLAELRVPNGSTDDRCNLFKHQFLNLGKDSRIIALDTPASKDF